MKRKLYSDLIAWKNSKDRKPLILEGARQVGKTWLLAEFGRNEYRNVVYINCDNNPFVKELFFDFDIQRIIRGFSAYSEQEINPDTTLIFIDEIQEIPQALTSLKYFCELKADYHVVAAGSLLGVQMHSGTGYPVGKVNSLKLYPLSFMEFLLALGKKHLVGDIQEHRWEELNSMSAILIELLRQYYFVGGMPAVVKSYIENQDLLAVRRLQNDILNDYKKDFSKHANKSIEKIMQVWDSIPSQLAKENKKFIYGAIKKGARAKDFENAIQWLVNAGLVHKVHCLKKIALPVKFYENMDCFKLFINDLGLLGAMVDAPAKEILIGNNGFSNYKGSFTEQYVAQQYFSATNKGLFYYSNENSTMEIDFVIQTSSVYPIEVKAEENLKSKSLSTVLQQNQELAGIRFSMSHYREQERMVNVPLYLVEEYFKTLP